MFSLLIGTGFKWPPMTYKNLELENVDHKILSWNFAMPRCHVGSPESTKFSKVREFWYIWYQTGINIQFEELLYNLQSQKSRMGVHNHQLQLGRYHPMVWFWIIHGWLTGAKRREWMGMGVAVIMNSYCGWFSHSLRLAPVSWRMGLLTALCIGALKKFSEGDALSSAGWREAAEAPLLTSQIQLPLQNTIIGWWLVVWNVNFIFPYIGNNNPNRLSYFSEG